MISKKEYRQRKKFCKECDKIYIRKSKFNKFCEECKEKHYYEGHKKQRIFYMKKRIKLQKEIERERKKLRW